MIASTILTLALLSKTRAYPLIRGRNGGEDIDKPPMLSMNEICFWSANNSEALLNGIEEVCDDFYDCDSINEANINCTQWETIDNNILSEEPVCRQNTTDEDEIAFRQQMEEWSMMAFEERATLREAIEENDETNAATVLGCGCCLGKESIINLVNGREGAVAKAVGLSLDRGGFSFHAEESFVPKEGLENVGCGRGDGKFGSSGRPGIGGLSMAKGAGTGDMGHGSHGEGNPGEGKDLILKQDFESVPRRQPNGGKGGKGGQGGSRGGRPCEGPPSKETNGMQVHDDEKETLLLASPLIPDAGVSNKEKNMNDSAKKNGLLLAFVIPLPEFLFL